jgi:hypothetical protein
MATNFAKNMIVLGMAAFCAVANAQTAQVDTTEVDGTVLQAIFGESTDRGCWHGSIRDGVATKARCNGFRPALGVEAQDMFWSSDLGSGSKVAVGPKASLGYKWGHFEPTVSFAYLFGGSIEGQSLSMPKASISLRAYTTKHDHKKLLKGYIEAGFTYMDVKSIDRVDLGTDWEEFEIPFHGYACFGKVAAGLEWNFSEIVKHSHTTVGKNNFLLDLVGHMALNVGLSYETSVVNKLEHYNTKSSVNLNALSVAMTLVIKPW